MTETALVRLAPELDRLARLGSWLAAAEIENPTGEQRGAAAALRMAYAESLGLSLLAASELSIIRGRLVVSAQLLRALADEGGYRIVRAESTEETCTAELWRGDEKLGEATFTLNDAKRAGLIRDRSAWTTHPARMLWARASANVIKDFAPAVALGLVTEEEAREIAYNREQETGVRAPIVLGPEVAGEPVEPEAEIEAEPEAEIEFGEPAPGDFEAPALREEQPPDARPLTDPQRKKIFALRSKLLNAGAVTDEEISLKLSAQYGTESISELTRTQASDLIDSLVKREQAAGIS